MKLHLKAPIAGHFGSHTLLDLVRGGLTFAVPGDFYKSLSPFIRLSDMKTKALDTFHKNSKSEARNEVFKEDEGDLLADVLTVKTGAHT
jgi:hypothetical protein